MEKKPLVSVVMPTYNRGGLVGRAIESVLNQTYSNLEFIIINDASTDNTSEVIRRYEQKDKRIRRIDNKDNLRIVRSLNRGLANAKGKYIARIDDDDVWVSQDKLKKQISFLERNPDYVVIGTGSVAILKSRGLRIKNKKPETDKEIRDRMLFECPFLHPAVVFRRDPAQKIGFYDERLERAEDYDLWMRLGKIGKMHNLPEYSIESMAGASNVSHRERREILKYNLLLIKRYRLDYPHFKMAYIKNSLEYLDASYPVLRIILWPFYKIRRFLLNNFSRKTDVEKL